MPIPPNRLQGPVGVLRGHSETIPPTGRGTLGPGSDSSWRQDGAPGPAAAGGGNLSISWSVTLCNLALTLSLFQSAFATRPKAPRLC